MRTQEKQTLGEHVATVVAAISTPSLDGYALHKWGDQYPEAHKSLFGEYFADMAQGIERAIEQYHELGRRGPKVAYTFRWDKAGTVVQGTFLQHRSPGSAGDDCIVVDSEVKSCNKVFANVATVFEPESQNPVLVLNMPLGISGVEDLIREFREWIKVEKGRVTDGV